MTNHIDPASAFGSAIAACNASDWPRAEKLLQAEIQANPRNAKAYELLGISHFFQERLIDAERCVRSALAIVENADFHFTLGMVLSKASRFEDAAAAYGASLKLDPNSVATYNNLANVYLSLERHDEAIDLFRKATQLQPKFAVGYANLGMCLFERRRFPEAADALERAVSLDPSLNNIRGLLAESLTETGRYEEAMSVCRSAGLWGQLQFDMRRTLSWDGLAEVDEAYLQTIESPDFKALLPPFRSIGMPGMTPRLERRAAIQHAAYSVRALQLPPMCEYRRVPSGGARLKIGYLSSDFHNHATLFLLLGVLDLHDPDAVEIFIFSYGPPKQDEYSKRLLALGIPVIDLFKATDGQAAQAIFEKQIDILVELKGYTDSTRLGISGRRPAPIIVSWLGYPGTLGYPRLADYVIADPVVTPPEHAPFFSERLALMPNCYQPNDRRLALSAPPTRREAGLPDEGIVFCSFNQTFKFNPQTFDIWARLIGSVPESVLWLLAPSVALVRDNITKEFEKRGISGNRIIFAQPTAHSRHLARMRLADLALDTFPYTSHTTGSDALWAGVPLVTRMGKTFASRVAASLLTAHGFPELITDNDEDYFRIALELATNIERRSELKERLDRVRATSPLFNTKQFTRDLEQLYRAIADNHNLPEQLRVPVVQLN